MAFRAAGIFLFLLLSVSAFSQTRIAFLELVEKDGKLVRLEPDFPYAHLAISYENGWLHAYPHVGVEFITYAKLKTYGRVREFIEVDRDLDREQVEAVIGKPYDHGFSWDSDKYYCSELVAKLVGIPPVPMHFDPKLWSKSYLKYEGLPGISPGIIYRRLKASAILE